jgi:hypothetical protein
MAARRRYEVQAGQLELQRTVDQCHQSYSSGERANTGRQRRNQTRAQLIILMRSWLGSSRETVTWGRSRKGERCMLVSAGS